MGLLDRWFGKGRSKLPSFTESDNVGTRQSTFDQAVAYWEMRNMRQKFDPFVLYYFSNERRARKALLELDCVHEAKDTGNLICTEPLIFGYYQTEVEDEVVIAGVVLSPKGGKYEAIVAGENLSHELWQKAKDAFEKHGGWRKNDREPEKVAAAVTKKPPNFAGKVQMLRKYTDRNRPGNPTYEDYECDDAELAKEFLMTRSVDRELYYVTVKTPMGTWGIDIKGLYKERLLLWQTDIAPAEIDGHILGIPDTFSLTQAAVGSNDSFITSIECGNCGHHWVEGVRYQNWTVVECPHCHKRNKVSSHKYAVEIV
ncbi:hypothetical protein FJY63_09540 [Candidatus Sumerlaeota bacterium]|nr:hypothetical protein [Candidatus Sumerlaeota bacterium]